LSHGCIKTNGKRVH